MADSSEVAKILSICVRKLQHPKLSYQQFSAFVERYVERYAEEYPQLQDLQNNTEEKLYRHLAALEEQGVCALSRDGERILEIVYTQHYLTIVQKSYEKLHQRPERLFPSEENLSLEAPEQIIVPVDITADLVTWLEREDEPPHLLRLIFPENVPSIIATSDLLGRSLIMYSLQKIRLYLRSEKNASYVQSKLQTVFRGREMALRDIINGILTNPDSILASVTEPDEFSFYFWAQLTNMLVKEFQQKKERLAEEEAVLQAAHLLGYHAVFYKGRKQKHRDMELARKVLERHLNQSPFAYSISEIYSLGDDKGVPITKNLSHERIQSYLAEHTQPPSNDALPDIIRTRTHENKDYYIRKEYVIPVVASGVNQASEEFKRLIVQHWTGLLKADKKMQAMHDDEAFERLLETNLKARYPVVTALLNPSLLLLAERETAGGGGGNARTVINRVVDRKLRELHSLAEILQLDRKTLYQDARLMLPFWQVVPGLAGVVRLLKRFLFGGGERRADRRAAAARDGAMVLSQNTDRSDRLEDSEPDGAAEDAPAPRRRSGAGTVRYQKAIRDLQREYLGENGDLDTALAQSIEQWNPLLDATAKKNLVEDVNALVRDFLRRMRVLSRNMPPEKSRIHAMAEQLAKNDAFKEIKRKREFQRYLELYMLKLLSKSRGS